MRATKHKTSTNIDNILGARIVFSLLSTEEAIGFAFISHPQMHDQRTRYLAIHVRPLRSHGAY